ncbi:cysteine synthase family protein [Candidatus Woesearchaeota archaeon]|nr:cysteine synthase family protein [Candidatus Woesearchaeota archaeon]
MTTPLIELKQYQTPERRLFAKIEAQNPTGSMKDRFVRYAIQRLEQDKVLRKGMTIVEASSGNTGIALSKGGTERGYKIVICMPKHISADKKWFIRQNGAEICEYDTTKDTEADIDAAREFGKQSDWYFLNQFENPYHIEAYYHSLGQEVLNQSRERHVSIDAVVAGVGTGASLIGLAKRIREEYSYCKIYAVSSKSSPTKIEGLHPGQIRGDFKIWLDRPQPFEEQRIFIEDEEAITYFKKLNNDGISVGISSGAVLAAALNHLPKKGNYVMLFHDHANRYTKYLQ